eukprot:SAG31_NODE_31452_length_368_cov_0.710037_1_plen_43_part_10
MYRPHHSKIPPSCNATRLHSKSVYKITRGWKGLGRSLKGTHAF